MKRFANRWVGFGAAVGVALVMSGGVRSSADEIQVIFSEVTGHPTATVPGALDLAGMPLATEFKAMEDFVVSPDGTQWLLKARNTAGSDLETMMLLGGGVSGTILAQEGQPVAGGVAGELYEFFDPVAGFNDNGDYAFGARARGGVSSVKEKVIKFDGSFSIVVQESDQAFGLTDDPVGNSGDELFGNSLNSIHLLNDGSVGFAAITISNISSTRRPALFYDAGAVLQSGVTSIGGGIWDSFDSNGFRTTPDGTHFLVRGDDEGSTTTDDLLAYDGTVVLREGSMISGSSVVVDGIFDSRLAADGAWFSRGDDASNDDWAVRSGTLVAKTGDPIVTGSLENWGDIFLAFNGNAAGAWVLAGNTDGGDPNTDSVIVLNAELVVVREGDPVDLDGNGMFDDDAFIGRGNSSLSAFAPNDVVLTDDNVLYFVAPLRDSMGNDLGTFGAGGEAFMRLQLPPDPCMTGNVGAEAGAIEETLMVNGSVGGALHTVTVSTGVSFTVSLGAGSMSPINPRYVIWVWNGAGVNSGDLNVLGSTVGCLVNPTPLSGLSPQPIFCLPSQGIPNSACGAAAIRNVSNFAPFSVMKPGGLAMPATFTFQGLLEDGSTSHPSGFSVTNSVTLAVQ